MADFLDYIGKGTKKEGEAFLEAMKKIKSGPELSRWFKGKGYDISPADCERIIQNKTRIKNLVMKAMAGSY